MIYWLIKKLVNHVYRKTGFFTWSWSFDENVDIHIQTEESYPGYYRFGTKEDKGNG